jgi:D-amino-acid dehydrogenase
VEPEVVVVGGGAVGVTAAYELARRGIRTTLLERDAAVGAGCSSGNAGLLCPSHSLPLATPAALREGVRSLLRADGPLGLRPSRETLPWLARFVGACRPGCAHRGLLAIRGLSTASLELHAELAALGTSFERRGILSVYETEHRLAAGRREAESSGLPSQALSAAGVRELEPALGGPVAGGVFHPEEAHVDPLRYVQAMGEAAAAAGAEIRTGLAVRALRHGSGRIAVETDEGELRPETVVLAAGAYTASLAHSLGVFVPVTGGKGYHVDLDAAPGDPRVPLLIQEARVAVTPLAGRLRLAGTLELSGLDLRVSTARVEGVRRAAARVLRGLDGRSVVDVWAGLRPCTPDGLPVIGRPAALPSLILATGHAMKGLSLAPVTARLVAQLAGGEPASHDLTPFSPDRFRPLLRRR